MYSSGGEPQSTAVVVSLTVKTESKVLLQGAFFAIRKVKQGELKLTLKSPDWSFPVSTQHYEWQILGKLHTGTCHDDTTPERIQWVSLCVHASSISLFHLPEPRSSHSWADATFYGWLHISPADQASEERSRRSPSSWRHPTKTNQK